MESFPHSEHGIITGAFSLYDIPKQTTNKERFQLEMLNSAVTGLNAIQRWADTADPTNASRFLIQTQNCVDIFFTAQTMVNIAKLYLEQDLSEHIGYIQEVSERLYPSFDIRVSKEGKHGEVVIERTKKKTGKKKELGSIGDITDKLYHMMERQITNLEGEKGSEKIISSKSNRIVGNLNLEYRKYVEIFHDIKHKFGEIYTRVPNIDFVEKYPADVIRQDLQMLSERMHAANLVVTEQFPQEVKGIRSTQGYIARALRSYGEVGDWQIETTFPDHGPASINFPPSFLGFLVENIAANAIDSYNHLGIKLDERVLYVFSDEPEPGYIDVTFINKDSRGVRLKGGIKRDNSTKGHGRGKGLGGDKERVEHYGGYLLLGNVLEDDNETIDYAPSTAGYEKPSEDQHIFGVAVTLRLPIIEEEEG